MLFSLVFLLSFVAGAIADVQFTSPSGGSTVPGGKTLSVKWKDSGDDPPLSDLQTYQLFLCAGGNDPDSFIQLTALAEKGDFSTGDSASGTVSTSIGGSDKNAYFLKMISATKGGTVINYSDRFSISGMTGTFPPNVQQGVKAVKGTSGPETDNQVQDGGAAGGGGADGTPYSLQTGATKFAPMQKKPGTKITVKSAKRLYPTSSAKIATTALPTPKQVTTMTQSATYSVSSQENQASPLPGPGADMQKFLNRWRD